MSLLRLRVARAFPVLCIVTVCAFAGCASTTTIISRPPGARLSLDGLPVGVTPYPMTDSRIVGTTTQLKLEYPGYQPLTVYISRNEEVDPLPLIAGIFLIVPLLWVMKYHPEHMFDLQPVGAYPMPPGAMPPGAPPYQYPPPPPEAMPPPPPAGYPPQQ
jgi:hypothetical protein